MNKIGPEMAKIQQKTFADGISVCLFPFTVQNIRIRMACISAIPGLILVIYPILKIPLAYSISFNWLHFLHGHCGNSYRDFK